MQGDCEESGKWAKFKEEILKVAKVVCGSRKIGKVIRRKVFVWQNEVVKWKKEYFLVWRRTGRENDLKDYRVLDK